MKFILFEFLENIKKKITENAKITCKNGKKWVLKKCYKIMLQHANSKTLWNGPNFGTYYFLWLKKYNLKKYFHNFQIWELLRTVLILKLHMQALKDYKFV